MLKELGDGAEDFEDVEDAGNGEFLVVEGGVDWHVAEDIGGGTTTENLDGADGVEYDGVDFTILYVLNGALSEGHDVAVIDFRLH